MFPYIHLFGSVQLPWNKKKVGQIDPRTSKSLEKYLCALQNTSVYRDFACIFMALNENKSQNFKNKITD